MQIYTANSRTDLFDQAYALFCEHRAKPWSKNSFVLSLSNCESILLVNDNILVGYLMVQVNFDVAEILDLCVDSQYQSQGYAYRLLCQFIDNCKKTAMQSIFLEVNCTNEIAIKLYQKVGFEHIDTRKNYYSLANGQYSDAYIYQLSFSAS